MSKYKLIRVFFILVVAFSLVGCSSKSDSGDSGMDHSKMDHSQMNHDSMNHSDYSGVTKGLKQAQNPTYPIGTQALINANHLEGMNGATATIVEAYDTYIYSVSYTPTTGGTKVENHKWVFQGELKDAGEEPFKVGTEVTLEADHMEGMKGAKAIIDSMEKTTVYMIDYTPTTGGDIVKNHKWVIESELSAKK